MSIRRLDFFRSNPFIAECKEEKLRILAHSNENKIRDWALVQNAALVMKISMLNLGLVRLGDLT